MEVMRTSLSTYIRDGFCSPTSGFSVFRNNDGKTLLLSLCCNTICFDTYKLQWQIKSVCMSKQTTKKSQYLFVTGIPVSVLHDTIIVYCIPQLFCCILDMTLSCAVAAGVIFGLCFDIYFFVRKDRWSRALESVIFSKSVSIRLLIGPTCGLTLLCLMSHRFQT